MKPNEDAFEAHIASWLVDHGGNTAEGRRMVLKPDPVQ